MAASTPEPAFLEAVALTTQTIDIRAKRFRNLVIAVVLVALGSVLWAGIQWSWSPLAGLLALVPLCGAFLYQDTCLVNRWRQQLLDYWTQERLDLDCFRSAVSAVRLLPAGTLQAMLQTLPTGKELHTSEDISPCARKAIALTLRAIHGCQADRTIGSTVAGTVGLAALAGALLQGSWLPLSGLAAVLPILGAGKCMQSFRWWRWKRQIRGLPQQGLSPETLADLVARLDWSPVSEKKKAGLLAALRKADGATRLANPGP
jgi:4-amino-4-deoxy-L-arabinose transferase-like glycosyltransferase